MFKKHFEKKEIINNSLQFLLELEKFCDDGTGHYKASFGHDDMVMAEIQLIFVINSLRYKMFTENVTQKVLFERSTREIYNPYDFEMPGQYTIRKLT